MSYPLIFTNDTDADSVFSEFPTQYPPNPDRLSQTNPSTFQNLYPHSLPIPQPPPSTIRTSSHLRAQPFSCKWSMKANGMEMVCNRVFSDPLSLYQHLCSDHVGRKCDRTLCLTCHWGRCNKSVTRRDNLTSHLRVHVPWKPFQCKLCSKTFKRKQDVKAHIKNRHKQYLSAPSTSQNSPNLSHQRGMSFDSMFPHESLQHRSLPTSPNLSKSNASSIYCDSNMSSPVLNPALKSSQFPFDEECDSSSFVNTFSSNIFGLRRTSSPGPRTLAEHGTFMEDQNTFSLEPQPLEGTKSQMLLEASIPTSQWSTKEQDTNDLPEWPVPFSTMESSNSVLALPQELEETSGPQPYPSVWPPVFNQQKQRIRPSLSQLASINPASFPNEDVSEVFNKYYLDLVA